MSGYIERHAAKHIFFMIVFVISEPLVDWRDSKIEGPSKGDPTDSMCMELHGWAP